MRHEDVDAAANLRHVFEWQMLSDEIEIGAARAQELEVRQLGEDARAELWRSRLGTAGVDVLQVREHEAILEAAEEPGGGGVGDQRRRLARAGLCRALVIPASVGRYRLERRRGPACMVIKALVE